MTTHTSKRGSRRYASYVCQRYQKSGQAACPGSRVSVGDLEQFVIERIRGIGKDPRLIRQTVETARRLVLEKRPDLEKDLRRLGKEMDKLEKDKGNLVNAVAQGGKGAGALLARLGEIEVQLQDLTRRHEDARRELAAIKSQAIDEEDLRRALASFDPIWDQLFPRERARVLQLLIETVTFNAQAGEVGITFRPGGIRLLAQDKERETA